MYINSSIIRLYSFNLNIVEYIDDIAFCQSPFQKKILRKYIDIYDNLVYIIE